MNLIAGVVVIAFGLSLVLLSGVIFVRPDGAERFLRLFASSARAHITEQVIRLIVGSALILFSGSMWFSVVFQVFGWVIAATAVVLLVLPWQWHHRFAQWAIPWAIRHMKIYGVGALVIGSLILYGASRAWH